MFPIEVPELIALFRRLVFLPDDVHWQSPYPPESVLKFFDVPLFVFYAPLPLSTALVYSESDRPKALLYVF